MLLSLCLTPVEGDRPCGDDLDEAGDNEYLGYMIAVRDRLPSSYVSAGTGEVFEPSTIKIPAEEKPILSLLKRSKDLRLIVILAQFRILGGDLAGFAECLEAMSALMKTWWADVHPVVVDGDVELREIALSGLQNRVRAMMPLTYLRLFEDRKIGYVTLRQYQIAKRPDLAYADEPVLEMTDIERAVASGETREEVLEANADIERCRAAIAEIRETWEAAEPSAAPPELDKLDALLAEIGNLLKIGAKAAEKQAAIAEKPADEPAAEKPSLLNAVRSVFRQEPAARATPAKIKNHGEAKAILGRLEEYFQTMEPSSPAGLLVRQARMLVGRPLIEALEALAPGKVDSVTIQVDRSSGFSLGVSKIRSLSVAEDDAARNRAPLPAWLVLETRQDVFSAIQTVEEFLLEIEPSSPVPTLLAQARSFMSKDFATIMKELLERPSE